jgi:hypothetical protein
MRLVKVPVVAKRLVVVTSVIIAELAVALLQVNVEIFKEFCTDKTAKEAVAAVRLAPLAAPNERLVTKPFVLVMLASVVLVAKKLVDEALVPKKFVAAELVAKK